MQQIWYNVVENFVMHQHKKNHSTKLLKICAKTLTFHEGGGHKIIMDAMVDGDTYPITAKQLLPMEYNIIDKIWYFIGLRKVTWVQAVMTSGMTDVHNMIGNIYL